MAFKTLNLLREYNESNSVKEYLQPAAKSGTLQKGTDVSMLESLKLHVWGTQQAVKPKCVVLLATVCKTAASMLFGAWLAGCLCLVLIVYMCSLLWQHR